MSLEKPNICILTEFLLQKLLCFKPQWQKQPTNNIKNVIKAPQWQQYEKKRICGSASKTLNICELRKKNT